MKRRTLLQSIPAIALSATATAATAFKMPDAPVDDIPDWFDTWKRQNVMLNGAGSKDMAEDEFDAAIEKQSELSKRIMEAKPTTLEGAAAQIELAIEDNAFDAGYKDKREIKMAKNIVKFLHSMAA